MGNTHCGIKSATLLYTAMLPQWLHCLAPSLASTTQCPVDSPRFRPRHCLCAEFVATGGLSWLCHFNERVTTGQGRSTAT